MSKRLVRWVERMHHDGMSDRDIAAGLDNGDLDRPSWLAHNSNTAIGFVLYDLAESDGSMHLYDLDLDDDGQGAE